MAFDKLDSISFERFLRQQDPFGRADACLDLSKITFVSAAAMVQLAAACYSLAEGSCRPSIVVNDESVRGYLAPRWIRQMRGPCYGVRTGFPSRSRRAEQLLFRLEPYADRSYADQSWR